MSDLDITSVNEAVELVDPTSAPAEPAKKWSRDEIRTQIFGAKPQHEPITLFGAPVELREPNMETVLDFQISNDRKSAIAVMMINYVFTADGEPVFEEGDVEAILQMPFNADVRNLQTKILALLGVSPTAEDKSPTEEIEQ